MPHIIILIYDENGNEIGQYYPPHDPAVGDGFAAVEDAEPAQAKMVLNLDKIAEIWDIKIKAEK